MALKFHIYDVTPRDSLEAREYMLCHNSFLMHTKAGALNLFENVSDLIEAGYFPCVQALKVVIPYDMGDELDDSDCDQTSYEFKKAWGYDDESTDKRIYADHHDFDGYHIHNDPGMRGFCILKPLTDLHFQIRKLHIVLYNDIYQDRLELQGTPVIAAIISKLGDLTYSNSSAPNLRVSIQYVDDRNLGEQEHVSLLWNPPTKEETSRMEGWLDEHFERDEIQQRINCFNIGCKGK